MSSEFQEIAFEDLKAPIKSAFAMGPFGSNIKAENFVPEGIPIIKGGNLNGNLNESSFDFLTPEKAVKLSSSIARRLDLVITHRGTLGQVGIIPENSLYSEYIVSQSQLKLSFDTTKVNPYFVYYFLRSSLGQKRLLENTSQVGVPAIAQALTSIRKIKIPLPDLKEQNIIVKTLRLFDDRINLLRETNTTLEAIAQALFKSWFVDFDPVRAKAEGRQPEGIDAETAALFPDSFEESELGLVPKGWNIGTLGESTSYLSRGISPKYTEDGGIIVINQKCIRNNSVDLSKARRHDPNLRKVQGRELLIGDILVNSTGVGTLGRVAQILSINEPLIVDSHVTVVRAGESLTWNYLGLSLLKRQSEIEQLGEGSTGQTELSRSTLAELRLIIPNSDILYAFDMATVSLREKFSNNLEQTKILATLRDILLPRLIPGQLRLPEAEERMEHAAT